MKTLRRLGWLTILLLVILAAMGSYALYCDRNGDTGTSVVGQLEGSDDSLSADAGGALGKRVKSPPENT